jgi:hypothetical protein
VDDELISKNPWKKATPPKGTLRTRILKPGAEQALLSFPRPMYRHAAQVILLTGLRREELCSICRLQGTNRVRVRGSLSA